MTETKVVAVASVSPDLNLKRTGEADDGFNLLAIDAFLEQLQGPVRARALAAAKLALREASKRYCLPSSQLAVEFTLYRVGTNDLKLGLAFVPKKEGT